MIEFTKAYKTSDGEAITVHATLVDAQKHELGRLLNDSDVIDDGTVNRNIFIERITDLLVTRADEVLDILTTTATSKPKARRINGGTKKRTPKPVVTPASEEVAS